ncbi:MAG TPA: TonB-dependent receptor [Saprospiraceae bacterium]|nr:TonB-dependent receptor [Saprospiraceae bacterium]
MKYTLLSGLLLLNLLMQAQKTPVQNIRGVVLEEGIENPLPFASIVILKTDPLIGVSADEKGHFLLENIPIGRYDIQISYLGFQSVIVKEIVVGSAKEPFIKVGLREMSNVLDEIVIKPRIIKEKPINPFSTVSARMLSTEEAQRYAGGFDDPARLASSFAGVASNVANNGIVIRGNAPKSLQWKMEGVEIPNPNHFAEVNAFGGGGLTALSSHMLANSDFFSGAFPAEYGNALSGVFDIFMRSGNHQKRESTFQVGILGIDLSSEGPFKKESHSSYLFNYRYSTLALMAPLLPEEAQGTIYQDLSFKLNFPTRKSGVFSIWGIGLIDQSGQQAKTDSTLWVYEQDRQNQNAKQFMGAMGVSHRKTFGNATQWKSTLAATVSGLDWNQSILNSSLNTVSQNEIQNSQWNFVFNSSVHKKFNTRHTNKTGIILTGMLYNMVLKDNGESEDPLETIVDGKGFSALLSAYSHSTIQISDRLLINAGLHFQNFTLNGHTTLEPRIGLKYDINENWSIGIAYGMHSRLEKLHYYFSVQPSNPEMMINRDLDFSKSNHYVAGINCKLTDNLILKIEPYYQSLFSIPVIPGTYFSFINLQNEWFINERLNNDGKGRNYGIDLTLEKFFSKGYYYMITGSIFKSEYTGGDEIWRHSMFNRNFITNILGGKEWKTGKTKQNIFGLNARLTLMGGEPYIPFNEAASISARKVILNYDDAYRENLSPAIITHFTVHYKINKVNRVHEIALKVLNANGHPDFFGHRFNRIDQSIDSHLEAIIIPNLSYKIDF